ncbi:hypothetical protein DVT68_14695 [Dyella solisilvae]|uniref:Uncharacterized protein n=1 Tax=Dyella solisilvae TaxID=1920168 RepID=A0A370K6P2_9GAMM|nr:hypothetical protein [Dyella solisilvae]RDI98309.1 hypothetical protein DVT68_14695 [Dyella solisilvae]
MKFFVPHASDAEEAERVYSVTAEFVGAPVDGPRIWKLSWTHNGTAMHAEVGQVHAAYRDTPAEVVIAIFDTGSVYMVCTPNRGVVRGGPILAGKGHGSSAVLFED